MKQANIRGAVFHGGLSPDQERSYQEDLPILEYADPQEDLSFPLTDEKGSPLEALVHIGDHVLADQPIAGPSLNGAVLFSSCSGYVRDIRPVPSANGREVKSLIIENDHLFERIRPPFEPEDYQKLSRDELLDRIQYASIPGGIHERLTQAGEEEIGYILLSAIDQEPSETFRYRTLLEGAEKALYALRVLQSLFPKAKRLVLVKESQIKAAHQLEEYLTDEDQVDVLPLTDRYPIGYDVILLYAALKIEVKPGIEASGEALRQGCLILHAEEAEAIWQAVSQARPVTGKVISVLGDCVKTPRNYRVPFGVSLQELVDHVELVHKRPRRVLYGGMMTGKTLEVLPTPVTGEMTSLTILSSKGYQRKLETGCFRCGSCVSVCPMKLQPYRLRKAADQKNRVLFDKLSGSCCIGCGCCSYLCPAGMNLTNRIRAFAEEEGNPST